MLNEDTLILKCARTQLSPTLSEDIRELMEEKPDWEYVLQASLGHGALPLVYRSLQAAASDLLPDAVRDRMKDHSLAVIARNMHMAAGLLKIIAKLKEHGITIVPFKGPVLAEDVYGNLGLRSFSDLDVLITPQDGGKAIDLLSAEGFTPLIRLSSSQLSAYMKTEDDMVLSHDDSGLAVELHWEMSGRYLARPLDMAFVSDRLETVPFLNRDVPALSSEDLLLYLCAHGTRHMWERLEWVCCVAELVRNKKNLQWDKTFRLARELKCCRILCHGLSLAHDLLGIELPPHVLKELSADPALPQLTEKICRQLFPLYQPDKAVEGGNRFRGYQFQLRDSQIDQVLYGWRQLTAAREADWRWLPLPGCLAFFYMIFRPVRLGWRYVTARYKV